jgi:DNA-binding FadR family transcriptional regulator
MAVAALQANLNDQVYDELRNRVLTRRHAPSEKLSLHILADELGVSRSPVHHALTRLVAEGLLTVEARYGYFVTPVTARALADGYDVRLALELRAAERTVGKIGAVELGLFRSLLEATAEAISPRAVGRCERCISRAPDRPGGKRTALELLPGPLGSHGFRERRGDLNRSADHEYLRSIGCNRLLEGRDDRGCGEEAEDAQNLVSHVANVVGLHGGNGDDRPGTRARLLVADGGFGLALENQQELLGAVAVLAHMVS